MSTTDAVITASAIQNANIHRVSKKLTTFGLL